MIFNYYLSGGSYITVLCTLLFLRGATSYKYFGALPLLKSSFKIVFKRKHVIFR